MSADGKTMVAAADVIIPGGESPVFISLNESLMTNRRCPTPLDLGDRLGRAVHAQSLLPAAVAYLPRSAVQWHVCDMNAPTMTNRTLTIVLSSLLLSGCCSPKGNARAPELPSLTAPEQRYVVDLGVGANVQSTRSIRFEGDWVILENPNQSTKELWIERSRVVSIGITK